MKHQVEGGSDAFCSACQEPGHYQAAHFTAPPRPIEYPWS